MIVDFIKVPKNFNFYWFDAVTSERETLVLVNKKQIIHKILDQNITLIAKPLKHTYIIECESIWFYYAQLLIEFLLPSKYQDLFQWNIKFLTTSSNYSETIKFENIADLEQILKSSLKKNSISNLQYKIKLKKNNVEGLLLTSSLDERLSNYAINFENK